MMMRHRRPGSLDLRAQENCLVVMPNKVAETKAAAGAGTEEGRRPTVVPAPAAANPELSDRPKRRTFTAGEEGRIFGGNHPGARARGKVGLIRRPGGSFTHPTHRAR